MSQERTEQPTAKHLSDAREKGQVARSRDLALAAAAVAATVALARLGNRLLDGLTERLASDLAHFGDAPLEVISPGDVTSQVIQGALLIALLVGPIAIATMVVGVGMHGFQGGWVFAPNALQLNWNRLNPANGVKKLGLMQSGMETLKTMISVSVITYLSWRIVGSFVVEAPRLAWLTPFGAAAQGWSHGETLSGAWHGRSGSSRSATTPSRSTA